MNSFTVTFYTTHEVIKAERKLKDTLEEVSTVPTPEYLSSDCGVSVKINTEKTAQQVKNILNKMKFEFKQVSIDDKE